MSEADDVMFGWAKKCVEDTQWLFHTPTLVVGPAEECFDGVATVYVSEVNGEPVTGPVIKLANGHALMANPNAFIELAPREVEFYRLAVTKFTAFMTAAVEHAAASGIPATTTVTLMVSLLQAQLRALEKVAKQEPVACTECGGSGEGADVIDGPGDVYQRKCSRCEGKGIEP